MMKYLLSACSVQNIMTSFAGKTQYIRQTSEFKQCLSWGFLLQHKEIWKILSKNDEAQKLLIVYVVFN